MERQHGLSALNEGTLQRLVEIGLYGGVQEAWDSYQDIKAMGGTPRCFFSRLDRFSVLNERDPHQVEICRFMEQKAKPFPLNCWEHKKCGREAASSGADDVWACPASILPTPDGRHNRGTRAGRRCWRIPGTVCDEHAQGLFKQKIAKCRECDFYQRVKEEEGDDFVE